MRQTHIAGEKLFVDFAGRTGEVVDGLTGEIIPVQIFVAVLGASSFTYAEPVWSQKLPDWIASEFRIAGLLLGFQGGLTSGSFGGLSSGQRSSLTSFNG